MADQGGFLEYFRLSLGIARRVLYPIKGLEVVANHWIIPPLVKLQQRGKLQSKHRNTAHQVVSEGYFAPADGIWDAIKTPSHR